MSERSLSGILNALLAGVLCMAASAVVAREPAVTDPTQPPALVSAPVAAAASAAGMRLYSTRVSDEGWVALINDRIVSVGSRINGAEVVSIEPGIVRLRRGDDTLTLQLEWPGVKSPVKSGE